MSKSNPQETIARLLADPIANYPAATVACFDATTGELPRRRLDAARNRQYLERLAAAGAPAVLIAASTGHGHLRTVDELAEWFAVAADANLGSAVKMALLRPEDGAAASARLIASLKEQGYAVVFARPGSDLPPDADDDLVARNMQDIIQQAAHLGLAAGVYSIPDVSGLALSAEAVAMLVNGPGGDHIVAAKITEADYESSTRRFLEHPALAKLKIVQGWDPHLARALQDGPRFDAADRQRVGVTSGPMAFAVHQYLHILSAAEDNDWDEVGHAQSAVTALFESMQDDRAKFADLQRAKYIMGLGHPLAGQVAKEQIERVFSALESLPRADDQRRLAGSLDLMGDGPYHHRLAALT